MTELSQNPEDICLMLKLLFTNTQIVCPDSLIEIQHLCPHKTRHPISHFFSMHDIEGAVRFAMELNKQGYNTYVGINSRKSGTIRSGKNSDIGIAFFHFGDFDSEASVRKFYQSTDKPRPHFRVITGDIPSERFHTYYRLKTPCYDMRLLS